MSPRPRKYPDQEKPLRQVAPTKRGYKQVYLKAERTDETKPSPYERLDQYRQKRKLVSLQDAILDLLDRVEPLGE